MGLRMSSVSHPQVRTLLWEGRPEWKHKTMHSNAKEEFVVPEVTAERVTLGRSVPAVEREHLCRYEYAKQFVEDKDVLDLACGTGYGGAMMFDAGARSVLGIDADSLTVAQAERSYARTG
jgi:predicted RNA methylase